MVLKFRNFWNFNPLNFNRLCLISYILESLFEGCFEFVGQDPSNEPLKNLDVINEKGYVLVDSQLETKVKGLFAAGDIIDKDVRQIVTAVNDGAIAALGASRYCK